MISEYVEATLLGVLQGVAEFLPISSSGHLVVAQSVIAETTGRGVAPERNLLLVVALHVGTLGSILWAYRRDLWPLARDLRYVGCVALATVPLVFIGLSPLKDRIEAAFDSPLTAGCGLLVTACFLMFGRTVERYRTRRGLTARDRTDWPAAIVVGLFQTVALVPGVSRSGSTIAGGLSSGTDRAEAVRFSLMIGIPALGGSGLLKAKDFAEARLASDAAAFEWASLGPIAVGTAVAFGVGLVAIRLLVRAVREDRLPWFAAYCATLGVAVIAWQLGS